MAKASLHAPASHLSQPTTPAPIALTLLVGRIAQGLRRTSVCTLANRSSRFFCCIRMCLRSSVRPLAFHRPDQFVSPYLFTPSVRLLSFVHQPRGSISHTGSWFFSSCRTLNPMIRRPYHSVRLQRQFSQVMAVERPVCLGRLLEWEHAGDMDLERAGIN
jgi:hypothetical protein